MANVCRSDPQSARNVQRKLKHSPAPVRAKHNVHTPKMCFRTDTNESVLPDETRLFRYARGCWHRAGCSSFAAEMKPVLSTTTSGKGSPKWSEKSAPACCPAASGRSGRPNVLPVCTGRSRSSQSGHPGRSEHLRREQGLPVANWQHAGNVRGPLAGTMESRTSSPSLISLWLTSRRGITFAPCRSNSNGRQKNWRRNLRVCPLAFPVRPAKRTGVAPSAFSRQPGF